MYTAQVPHPTNTNANIGTNTNTLYTVNSM